MQSSPRYVVSRIWPVILDADAMLPLQTPISCLSCRRCLDVRTRSFLDWVDVSESIPASAQSLVHVSTILLGVLLRRSCAVPCILKRIVDACGPKKIGVDDGDMTSDGTDGNLHSACLTLCLTAATRAVAHPQPTSALWGSTPPVTLTYTMEVLSTPWSRPPHTTAMNNTQTQVISC